MQQQKLICVCGGPGSGKTTYCHNVLKKEYPNAKIISLDGYHTYRKDLSEDQMKRRGAYFTFQKERFWQDIKKLKETKQGSFPSFEHNIKDPIEDEVKINENDKVVIIEGLYLLIDGWKVIDGKSRFINIQVYDLFDEIIFMDGNWEIIKQRVAQRHFDSGIVDSYEKGLKQAEENDKLNWDYVRQNSVMDKVSKTIKTT